MSKSGEDDQERLAGLRSLGGNGRSKEEEKEYRKLMAERRKVNKDASTNMFETLYNLEEDAGIEQKSKLTRKEQKKKYMANRRKRETSAERASRLDGKENLLQLAAMEEKFS